MIERAKAADIPRILELLIQVNMVHHNGRPDLFKGPTTKYDEKELAELLLDEERPVFVCRDDAGLILGYAFCVLRETRGDRLMQDIRTLYIDDLCVDEASRGQGVGRRLYRHVLDYARQQGCYNVTLNVWACNPGARAFYERLGMTEQNLAVFRCEQALHGQLHILDRLVDHSIQPHIDLFQEIGRAHV